MDFIYPQQPMSIASTTAPGSGGVVIPPQMQKILDQPGYLSHEKGGLELRRMYSDQASAFNPRLLSDFARDCFLGNLEGVKKAVESGTGPDLVGTEGALKFGYVTLLVSGKRHIASTNFPVKHAETLSYLLSRGCSPDVEDITGLTALTHATMHKASSPIDLARILLQSGANVNHRDRYGQVPILNAFMTDNLPSIDLLMEFGADLDIADSDNCVPRKFFVSCGPQVAATVSKWLRKRSGEEGLLAEKECGNCKCAGPKVSLKLCAKCRSIRYCSIPCQRSHWPTHKKACHPFSASNTVTLMPTYTDHGTTMPLATMMRNLMDIPTDPTPQRHTRGPRAPKSSDAKSLVVKVQVPWLGPVPVAGSGPLLVYTKKRDFVCQIMRADNPAGYDRICEVVRTRGVGGAKAYFTAELESKYELVVKVSEVLATQPW